MPMIRVFDLESCGFAPPEPPASGVCEIAFVNLVARQTGVDRTDWSVEGGVSAWLTNPGQPIPPETSAIHHIVDEDVLGAPPFETIAKGIFDHDYGEIALAAHSAKMEQQWLTPELTRGLPWICSYKCGLRLWPDAPSHSNQALRYWRRPEGLDRRIASVAHRAGPDAYVTAFHVRDLLQLAPIEDLIKWSSEPALQVRCHIGKWRGSLWRDVDFGFLEWVSGRDFDEDVLFTVHHEMERRETEWRKRQQDEAAETDNEPVQALNEF